MKGDPNIVAVWENLPDPSSTASPGAQANVIVPERMWRKFVGKHICNSREPWSDVFGDPTVKQLTGSPHGPFSEGPGAEASQRALATLEGEVRRSLIQPLVLIYTSLGERRIDGQRWVIPLPSGAIAVVYVGGTEKTLRTCYFTGAAGVIPLGRRWQITVRELVAGYAAPGKKAPLLPDRRYRREKSVVGVKPEMCVDIRFVDPEMWGFASGAPGSEWKPPTWGWQTSD